MRQTGGQRVVAWLVAGLVFAWALPSWAQSWSYRRETDEMTDRTNHFASVRVGSGYRPAVFFAACRNDDLELWLAPNDYIGSSDQNGPQTSRDDSRIYIDYRVNDEPAQEGRLANLSTDEDAFFFQDHADIIRGLIGKRLIVKWRDYRGTSTTLTIPTRGAAAALKKLPCARPYIPNCGDGETQLTWSTPSDLDSTDEGNGAGADLDLHVLNPLGCWEDREWDCHFRTPTADWGVAGFTGDDCSMDRDDTDGWGPENVSLDDPAAGTYKVGVHYWSDHGYGVSYATVIITLDGTVAYEVRDKAMPTTGTWWEACAVSWPSRNVVPIDRITATVPVCR